MTAEDMIITEAVIDNTPIDPIEEATYSGAGGMLDLVMGHIRDLRKEWDHIEAAVQVLDALTNRIGEDTK